MSTGFRYNPYSQSTQSLKVLIPEEYQHTQVRSVDLVDPKGKVIETGNYKRFADNRENYHFERPGWDYPSDVRVRMVTNDGKVSYYNPADGLKRGEPGPGSSGAGYNPSVHSSPGGNPFVMPGAYGYGAIPLPWVDFQQILEDSKQLAAENRDTYFAEITGEDARNAALGLVDTDIEGIRRGINALAPIAREQGRMDTAENIARAGQIDEFNFQRIPGFNEFNRTEHEAGVTGSGLDYKGRITELLDQLRTQSTGQLSGDMNRMLTEQLKNEASDINSASGIGSISGAGVRASDRLNIRERMSIMDRAQSMIPGVLTTAQQVLQAPTIYAQPQDVPFTPSTIESRMPIQSNISAGNAQLQIGTAATEIGTIEAENAMTQQLATEQFNESAGFNGALAIGDRIQGQMMAADNAVMGGLNADKADQVRNQVFDAYEDAQTGSMWGSIAGGLATAGAGWLFGPSGPLVSGGGGSGGGSGSLGGGIAGAYGGSSGGAPGVPGNGGIFGGYPAGGGGGGGGVSGAIGSIFSGIGRAVEAVQGWFGPSESTQMGDQTVTTTDFQDYVKLPADVPAYTREDFRDQSNGFDFAIGGTGGNGMSTGEVLGQIADEPATSAGVPEGIDFSPSVQRANPYLKMTQPAPTPAQDAELLSTASTSVEKWNDLDSSSKFNASGNMGVGVLQAHGVVSAERAQDMKNTAGALAVLLDPDATSAQRASAIAQAGLGAVTRTYTGDLNNPKTISGMAVVGQSQVNGEINFQVRDGQGNVQMVPKSEILESANSALALSAFNVITSNADDETKIAALGSIGIKGAQANGLLADTYATGGLAALQVFNTARNWDEMNALEQTVATVQTSASVLNAANASLAATTGSTVGATALAYAGPVAAAVTAAYVGGKTAQAIYKSNKDLPESQRFKANSQMIAQVQAGPLASIPGYDKAMKHFSSSKENALIGAALSPAAIGMPMLMGAVSSIGGTGKNTGQLLRDSWREGLKSAGAVDVDKSTGAWNITLADGSKYDIGKDGGAKLQNVGTNIDGKTERNTFDVDWSNPLAVNSIPDAHLLAIATGLDPTGTSEHGLFDRATAQMLNAVTSNTTDIMGVKDNVRAILEKQGVAPEMIAGRVEILRNQNMISDQEYSTYLNHINGLYGTEFSPTDKAESTAQIVSAIESKKGTKTKAENALLASLRDPSKQEEALKKLNKRLAAIKKADGVKETDITIDVRTSPSDVRKQDAKPRPNPADIRNRQGQGNTMPEGVTTANYLVSRDGPMTLPSSWGSAPNTGIRLPRGLERWT